MRMDPWFVVGIGLALSTCVQNQRIRGFDTIAKQLPLAAVTNAHGQQYGDFQIQGVMDERIKVYGRAYFDDSFCAFETQHDSYIPVVGGLILCRCESIYYNWHASKHFLPVKVRDYQATNSDQWQEGDWTRVETVFIEDTVCSPGPCCKKGMAPPQPPPGYVPKTPITTTVRYTTISPETTAWAAVTKSIVNDNTTVLPGDQPTETRTAPAARPEFIVGTVFLTLSLASIIGILVLMVYRIRTNYKPVTVPTEKREATA